MPRLDQELLSRGLCDSRARAQRAIADGYVRVNDCVALKPSQKVTSADAILVNDPDAKWVSRAALKILPSLEPMKDAVALDLGASTGGFTQVLLENGARKVFAVDVGHGQLHASLQGDPRILMLEGFNVKDLDAASFDDEDWPKFDIITSDLSFISLEKALPRALDLAQAGALLIALIKPQFELDPSKIGKGGIVRDAADALDAVSRVSDWVHKQGWEILSCTASPIKGGDGNQEYVLKARKL